MIAKAPGKVILTGEHFVVLGASALSMAINLHSIARARKNDRGTVEVEATIPVNSIGQREIDTIEPESLLRPLRIAAQTALENIYGRKRDGRYGARVHVECEIPVGAGLGSSASTSVAIIAAVAASHGRVLTRKEIFELAYKPEKIVHSKPSGIDQATSTYGGLIEYRSGGIVETIKVTRQPGLVVCDTGVHRSTGKLVGEVVNRSRIRGEEGNYQERVKEVTAITTGARRALEQQADEDLGELMNRNQELLAQIGVSHPILDRLILTARRNGALGAKLTGAGGGGCMIALCKDDASRRRVIRSLLKAGGIVYDTRLSSRGVTVRL